jgi:adenylate cyclase class 2
MQTEIEATFTQIDVEAVRAKLTDLGAVCVHPERLMRRKNYDYEDNRLNDVRGWVRLRDEGDVTTLAYKQVNDRTLHGTQEVFTVVKDFAATDSFLVAIGLIEKTYQETKRESWMLDGVEVEIDTWPWIPSYLEIEGKTEKDVQAVAAALGFDWGTALFGSVENVYQEIYDVTEHEIDAWELITFTEVPEWLELKRR